MSTKTTNKPKHMNKHKYVSRPTCPKCKGTQFKQLVGSVYCCTNCGMDDIPRRQMVDRSAKKAHTEE